MANDKMARDLQSRNSVNCAVTELVVALTAATPGGLKLAHETLRAEAEEFGLPAGWRVLYGDLAGLVARYRKREGV